MLQIKREIFFSIRILSKDIAYSAIYFNISSSHTKHLLEKARQALLGKIKFENNYMMLHMFPSVFMNLLKAKSPDGYWQLLAFHQL